MSNRILVATLIAALSTALALPATAATADINYAISNRFGGPVYVGAPAFSVTAALVKIGGGAGHFSIAQALTAMLGAKLTDAEVAKLTKQYGKASVDQWVKGFNFAVDDALAIAVKQGTALPAPADLAGTKLAAALVSAGVDPKTDVFWSGLLYDKALSHGIHDTVMGDIDAKYGVATDATVHRITNQAMYDLAHALGNDSVQLAGLH